jgi:hypothetical protein
MSKAMSKAEATQAREAHVHRCADSLRDSLMEMSARAHVDHTQWTLAQHRQLEDAVLTASRTPWTQLDPSELSMEIQASKIRVQDERARAVSIVQTGREANALYPGSINASERSRAGMAVQAESSLLRELSIVDGFASTYARCARSRPTR